MLWLPMHHLVDVAATSILFLIATAILTAHRHAPEHAASSFRAG